MRKHWKDLYILLVLTLCLLPTVGMLFQKTGENKENRQLALAPVFWQDGKCNPDFLSDCGAYFEDHFAFRQELVSADNWLRKKLFQTSAEPQVLTGSDDWLYYEATVDDYTGRELMSNRQLFNAARNLKLMQDCTEAAGGKFLFTIAPNKNSVYGEHMPSYIKKVTDEKNYQLLQPYLAAEGIHYVDLYPIFEKSDELLYFAGDSHWNNKGALLVYDRLLDEAKKPHDDYSAVDFSVKKDYIGDLRKMVSPKFAVPEKNYYYNKAYTYSCNADFSTVEDSRIWTKQPHATGSLLLYRDSFGNSLLPFFAEEFAQAYFSKNVPYNLSADLQANQPTLTIVEHVERHLKGLAQQAPLLQGMPVTLEGAWKEEKTDTTLLVSENGPYWQFVGMVDERFTDEDSRIYLEVEPEGLGAVCFEACPISYRTQERSSDYGYQLLLSKEAFDAKTAHIKVLVEQGESYTVVYDNLKENN